MREVERGTTSVGEGIERTVEGIGNTVVAAAKDCGCEARGGREGGRVHSQVSMDALEAGASDGGRGVSGSIDRLFGR
jgi:hypothetical protein